VVLVALAGGGAWVVVNHGLPIIGLTAGPSPASPPVKPSSSDDGSVAEEFSGTALDTHRWVVYQGTTSNGSIRSASAVQVTDGELQVTGTGRDPTGHGNQSGGLCWCGPGGDRTYGVWRVRARFDAGAGYSQTIGLWPKSNKRADGIIVFAGTPEPQKTTLHGSVVWAEGAGASANRTITGDFTGWHTYMVEWRSTSVKMYVDGDVFYDSATSTPPVDIPHQFMHLYIQQDVGPLSGVPPADASTPDRVLTHIDWVQVLA
jgi:beta-glucanase (GH16 family)